MLGRCSFRAHPCFQVYHNSESWPNKRYQNRRTRELLSCTWSFVNLVTILTVFTPPIFGALCDLKRLLVHDGRGLLVNLLVGRFRLVNAPCTSTTGSDTVGRITYGNQSIITRKIREGNLRYVTLSYSYSNDALISAYPAVPPPPTGFPHPLSTTTQKTGRKKRLNFGFAPGTSFPILSDYCSVTLPHQRSPRGNSDRCGEFPFSDPVCFWFYTRYSSSYHKIICCDGVLV